MSRSKIFLACNGHMCLMVSLNSSSAWSISSAVDKKYILILFTHRRRRNTRFDKLHRFTTTATTSTFNYNTLSIHYAHSPHRIFMLRFSRMSANSVVVNCTLPSWSTGMFIRMSFLYAKRLGHLLPKPNGGSMFLSISYISV